MLTFPANARASLKLLQLLDDPEFHLDAALQLVLAEPVIAARLVALANSAIFAHRGVRVENVRGAVNLLGMKTLRTLVASIVVRQVCGAIADPALRAEADQLWRHCAQVAALASVIARDVARTDPDTAMFAGIVHEVGSFYRLYRHDGGATLAEGYAVLSAAAAAAALTRDVLEVLMVPPTVIEAVSALGSAQRRVPPASLADSLQLANDLATVRSPFEDQPVLDASIDCPVGATTLQAILAARAEEIAAASEALLV